MTKLEVAKKVFAKQHCIAILEICRNQYRPKSKEYKRISNQIS